MAEELNKDTAEQLPPQQPADGAAPEGGGEAAAPSNPNLKWYIIHTYSGFERKVRESLE